MKTICTVLARGGSKGVKNKNLKTIRGNPLLCITLEQAKRCFEHVVFSSDDETMLELASGYRDIRVHRRRPEDATDEASKLTAIQHVLEDIGGEYDTIVDLAVTSPFRSARNIADALDTYLTKDASSVLSACLSRASPYFNIVEQTDDGVALCKQNGEIVRRQDAPRTYTLNGAVYVWNYRTFMADPRLFYPNTALTIMPEEHSLDIDTEYDLELANLLYRTPTSGKPEGMDWDG